MVSKVMEKTGVTTRDRKIIYNVLVHTVMLYGSVSWVITETTMKVLEEFHYNIDRRITGNTDRHIGEEGWE